MEIRRGDEGTFFSASSCTCYYHYHYYYYHYYYYHYYYYHYHYYYYDYYYYHTTVSAFSPARFPACALWQFTVYSSGAPGLASIWKSIFVLCRTFLQMSAQLGIVKSILASLDTSALKVTVLCVLCIKSIILTTFPFFPTILFLKIKFLVEQRGDGDKGVRWGHRDMTGALRRHKKLLVSYTVCGDDIMRTGLVTITECHFISLVFPEKTDATMDL